MISATDIQNRRRMVDAIPVVVTLVASVEQAGRDTTVKTLKPQMADAIGMTEDSARVVAGWAADLGLLRIIPRVGSTPAAYRLTTHARSLGGYERSFAVYDDVCSEVARLLKHVGKDDQ